MTYAWCVFTFKCSGDFCLKKLNHLDADESVHKVVIIDIFQSVTDLSVRQGIERLVV